MERGGGTDPRVGRGQPVGRPGGDPGGPPERTMGDDYGFKLAPGGGNREAVLDQLSDAQNSYVPPILFLLQRRLLQIDISCR